MDEKKYEEADIDESSLVDEEDKPDIYTPEFIPFYISIKKKYKLSDLETKIYGFVRFYTHSSSRMF